jgi:hypothetical protein
MPNLLDTGAAWLIDQLQSHASRTVSYRRGAASVDLLATRGRTEFQATDTEGTITTEYTDADFLVEAALLILSGSTIVPRSGDRIVETIGTTVRTYEVLPRGGLMCYSVDPMQTVYRIHTKLIETA